MQKSVDIRSLQVVENPNEAQSKKTLFSIAIFKNAKRAYKSQMWSLWYKGQRLPVFFVHLKYILAHWISVWTIVVESGHRVRVKRLHMMYYCIVRR